MVERVRSRQAMIAGMDPWLDPQAYVFCVGLVPHEQALAWFREAEGLSQILPVEVAVECGHDVAMPMTRLVLQVNSALDGVGLTAAVATALAEAQIPCNVVAAYHHDHVFVPQDQAARALAILLKVQQNG